MKQILLFTAMLLTIIVIISGCSKEEANPISPKDEYYLPIIDPDNFTDEITNPYWPMTTGRSWNYEGSDGELTESIIVEVLNNAKTVMGIPCTVVRDRVSEDGELVEDTYDWYAQDLQGNVWYMGEDSKEIEDGKVVSTEGSWEAGIDGAQPGIVMWAEPFPVIPYRQEYYFEEAEDWGQVIDILDSLVIGIGVYYNILQTKEWTPLEPDVAEYKYYAPDVGLIKEEVISGGSGVVELIGIQ